MIECFKCTKSYSLGIEDIFQLWYYRGGWKPLTQEIKDSEWYCEEYEWSTADSGDLLACWLENYVPGVKSWDDYGDMHVTVDMEELEEAGWDEDDLIKVLERMAFAINVWSVIRAIGEPWVDTYKDDYGAERFRHRYPPLIPLEGMTKIEYPKDLTI